MIEYFLRFQEPYLELNKTIISGVADEVARAMSMPQFFLHKLEDFSTELYRNRGDEKISNELGIDFEKVQQLKNMHYLIIGSIIRMEETGIPMRFFSYDGHTYVIQRKYEFRQDGLLKTKVYLSEFTNDNFQSVYGKYNEGSGEQDKLMLQNFEVANIQLLSSPDGVSEFSAYIRENTRGRSMVKGLLLSVEFLMKHTITNNPDFFNKDYEAKLYEIDTSDGHFTGKIMQKYLGFEKVTNEGNPEYWKTIEINNEKNED